ncbi:expressed unknown protein [Seminavis robusta]|uniref:Uncharacterized protein n=1 Tax=Seminavis robusta TaxID=568900 RepID=A0A9N8DC58_9STRA|nr:expressed unknown protein [Seminavis robusta]|eukprot:Sro73_g040320.1 n/a (266) ;mRNA; f:51143-51940
MTPSGAFVPLHNNTMTQPPTVTATGAALVLNSHNSMKTTTMNFTSESSKMPSSACTSTSATSSSSRQRRRVRFCEQANQQRSIDCSFSQDEHKVLWYSQQEFQAMKSNRVKAVAVKQRNTNSCCCADDLRGLEKLLPNGRHLLKHRRKTLRAIVEMYHQIDSIPCPSDQEKDERDEVLRSFAVSKTRYAQHTAKYVAAQDAAAALCDDCCGKQLSSSSSSSCYSRTATARRQQPFGASKPLTVSTVNSNRRSLVQRRVPMRAKTA